MKNITIKQLKDMWIKFYQSKGHKQISSSSVVPEGDSSVLFTTAGMQPLVPYLLGQKHQHGTRLVNYQACIRTNDIESVGDTSHLTFFEMLGRWSLGDYNKLEAIEMSYEFLTSKSYLSIPLQNLFITVFEGDDDAPKDTGAYEKWLSLGILPNNIFFLPKKDNWWALGETGPCGPDSEMYYVQNPNNILPGENPGKSEKFLEIGNDVFMSYMRDSNGNLNELESKNIDTGLGLERNVVALNGYDSVYQTDAFSGAIAIIEQLSGKKYGSDEQTTRAIRVVADHLRTSTMVLGDPTVTLPSNVGRGYVLRRLIRRAVRFARELGIENLNDLQQIADFYVHQLGEYYSNLLATRETVLAELQNEINKFAKTLSNGLKELERVVEKLDGKVLDGALAFRLYDTYGFPIEITTELLSEQGLQVDLQGYEKAYEQHQALSRGSSAQMFKSGLAGTGGNYNRYHTATHLLHAVLRNKFGETVKQAGSAINEDRMRFDFTFERKLAPEEVQEVQKEVNGYIEQGIEVERLEMEYNKAMEMGAIGLFSDKYSDNVSVYKIGDVSIELCSGPHVNNTSEVGKFVIKKEESSSSGVRRIRAVIEEN